MERQKHPSDYQKGSPDQAMEEKVAYHRFVRKSKSREAEHEDPVAHQVAGHRLKVDPAEHKGESDRGGEQTAPHDQQVRQPARPTAPPDEQVQHEHTGESGDE